MLTLVKKNVNNYSSINVSTIKDTKYMKQKMAGVQGEIAISTIIFGDFIFLCLSNLCNM